MYGIAIQEVGTTGIREYTPLQMPRFSISRYSQDVSTPHTHHLPLTPFYKSEHANTTHHSPPIPSPATQILHA
jgi:hypothetical protein